MSAFVDFSSGAHFQSFTQAPQTHTMHSRTTPRTPLITVVQSYPTHPSDPPTCLMSSEAHHVSPFCTDWTLSARARHPAKAQRRWVNSQIFAPHSGLRFADSKEMPQILASYDMWRSFAWENSEQASNSISFKFKQISVENLRMVSPLSRWGVCQAWCHEAPLQRSTWIVTTWVERTWIQRLHTFISKDKGLSYGLCGQGRTNLRAALLMLDSHQSPLHRIRCTYGIWS